MEVTYRYKARDKFGKSSDGQMAAGSDTEVAAKLKERELTPFLIEPVEQSLNLHFLERFRRFKHSDVNAFTRELYTLTKAGLTILASLEVIGEQDRNPLLKKIVEGLMQSVRGGTSVADSLARFRLVIRIPNQEPAFIGFQVAGRVFKISLGFL